MFLYTDYLSLLIYSLLLTIFLEIIFSIIFGLRKKDLINVLLVNVLTNPLINCIHPLFLFEYGKTAQIICLFILEILVVIVEGFVYQKTLNYKRINLFVLSLILNLISFMLGTVLNYFIF